MNKGELPKSSRTFESEQPMRGCKQVTTEWDIFVVINNTIQLLEHTLLLSVNSSAELAVCLRHVIYMIEAHHRGSDLSLCDSHVGQLADWTSRGLDNSRMSPVVVAVLTR